MRDKTVYDLEINKHTTFGTFCCKISAYYIETTVNGAVLQAAVDKRSVKKKVSYRT